VTVAQANEGYVLHGRELSLDILLGDDDNASGAEVRVPARVVKVPMGIYQPRDGTHRGLEDRVAQFSNPRSESAIDQQGTAVIDDRRDVSPVSREDI
jgi:hypothetical protein